ncbi:MAG: DNA-binding transcriptional regulator GbsR (MarR family), partial [Cyclobacteriaceae bacterium]
MEYAEAKATLIQAWGTLGSSWGINRTMAQIHILLLISPDPLSTENVMDELSISRGNANMNLRSLLEWGVIYKNLVPG